MSYQPPVEFVEDPDRRSPTDPAHLVVNIEGYEGPIDVLLTLAREQKLDLTKIKILELADQYLAFIAEARALRLELAADYLVMAAWLVYLKSRLLLPEPQPENEPTAAELAEHLAFQLQRLEAMQEVGRVLMARPRLGVDLFARGMVEPVGDIIHVRWDVSLYDLLKAYGDQKSRQETTTLRIAPTQLYSVEDMLEDLLAQLGRSQDWEVLMQFLPEGLRDPVVMRSAIAATFGASLELAKNGLVELMQAETYGPIYLRPVPGALERRIHGSEQT